jgi:FAD binding domain
MNMGIADAVDLGWKIAAVLQGWGGAELLASYERERRPVHNYVMDEAVANHAVLGNQLWVEGIEDSGEIGARVREEIGARIQRAKVREFNTLGVVLGYRYDDSPVIIGDGTAAPALDFRNYVPSARPGGLTPHAWLDDGSSLYDHFGQGFTLLASREAQVEDIDRAQRAARDTGIPLTIYRLDRPAIADLYQARYALIRPDQHVAWRGDIWPTHAERLLERVAGRARVQGRSAARLPA